MVETRILFLKDIPVLSVRGFEVSVLEPDLLPYALRYPDVSFDDIFHGWTEARILNISRSNAKKILAGFGVSQVNSYQIANLMRFASLKDCYWLKSEEDPATWDDVSLFRQPFDGDVADTALFGKNLLFSGKILSPEPTTLGMSAKAWYRDLDGSIWLYKIGRKELAASEVLEAIGAQHVPYRSAMDELTQMADEKHFRKIIDSSEILVKCPLITDESRSIVTWDDWQVYCERNGKDPYDIVKDDPRFHEMRIADYILGNEDRHGENWGFYMDNDSCRITGMLPLFDHDHSFSNEDDLICQTSDRPQTLGPAAHESFGRDYGLCVEALLQAGPFAGIKPDEQEGMISRAEKILFK